ncbi:thioesterase domain-containing protein [Streptomyces xinghaiensis]|uniref:thioesterase domain-containing protein n=1 Tax=Streptomyces xinghaiensis TaxID=1038928 RepID=UPI0002E981D8|nr:thioesterase domain-containing protein [Streptomyces xinghaiensis]MZE79644.1 thioesterase [Streptomyces sp. SID5475]
MTTTPAAPAVPPREASLLTTVSNGRGLARRSVLLHPAGGGIGPYLGIALQLSRRSAVYGLRAAGLMAGERPDRSVPGMVRRYLRLVDGLGGPPDLLLGWSLGGTLAWELASVFAERGHRPRVVMIDSPAQPVAHDAERYGSLRERVTAAAGVAPHGPDAALVARTTDAHIAAVGTHRVRSAHDCPTLLITCTGGTGGGNNSAHLATWRALSSDLRVREIPCGHFEVLTPARLPAVLEHLTAFLHETDFGTPVPGPDAGEHHTHVHCEEEE